MNAEEIRRLLEHGKLVIGRNESRRALERREAKRILIAANAETSDAESMRAYAQMSGAEIVALDVRNDQLGTVCRKPFPISFCAVKE